MSQPRVALVVGRRAEISHLVVRILEQRLGCRVHVAASPADARAALPAGETPSVCVIDLGVADVPAADSGRELRRLWPAIRILALVPPGRQGDVPWADAVMEKPFDVARLEATVRSWLPVP